MQKPKQNIIKAFKDEFSRMFVISFGVFLFILFFQPFPLGMLDYDNRLIYVAGFGLIIFLLACITLIILPVSFSKLFLLSEWESGPPFMLSFLLLVLTSTAFAFYIRYVGKVVLTLYIMFKIVLVCLIPIIILVILYKNKSLERLISILREQNKYHILKIHEYEKKSNDEEIEIISDNKSENLILKYKNIVAVKSADNYIEIFYLENDVVEKKLIRNTLKNIEQLFVNKQNLIRCHRTSIVNIIHVEKLIKNYSGYSLKIFNLDEKIHVSRQYLIPIKEALSIIK